MPLLENTAMTPPLLGGLLCWPQASGVIDLAESVNAGEILQRPAGVKVQHGRKQEGPDIGAFLLVSFHS